MLSFCAVICIPSFKGSPDSLVMKDQTEVCLLSREVMLPPGATSILSITEWLSLSQSSSIRTTNSFPYEAPARMLPCSATKNTMG